MKRLPLALIAALALGALPASAAEHDHGHGHGPATLQLDHGKKWPTDEALRRNMTAMAAALAPKVPAVHQGSLAASDYGKLGQAIEGHVGQIIAQCKLAPEADAMLHLVVAELLGAADVLQGRAAGQPAAAVHKAVGALNDYGRHFDHPDWRPIL